MNNNTESITCYEDREHMIELMDRYHSDDSQVHQAAKEQLLEENRKLLTFFIKRFANSYLPEYLDPLFNEMVIMFLEKIGSYDPRKAKLSTFLTNPAMRVAADFRDQIGKCKSSYYSRMMREVKESMERLRREGLDANVASISLDTGYSIRCVTDAIAMINAMDEVSYDQQGDEQDRLEKQMVEFAQNPEDEAIHKEGSKILQQALLTLCEEDARILTTKFATGKNLSYAETGKILGIPSSRVKRSITRSLKILRSNPELNAWYERTSVYNTAPDGEEVSFVLTPELADDYDLLDETPEKNTISYNKAPVKKQLVYLDDELPILEDIF